MILNEFGNLKKVVVGTELNFSKRAMDFTFRNMYKENLKLDSIYNNIFDNYELNYELVQERITDLDNLAKVLEDRGIEVIRPDTYQTPQYFEYESKNYMKSAASNVRDLTFTYDDFILETPVSVINRLHENELFLNKVYESVNHNIELIKPKQPLITKESMDTSSWEMVRDRLTRLANPDNRKKFTPFMDAANMIKINDDIICNIGSVNQYNYYENLKETLKVLGYNVKLHMVFMADSHIDGTLLPLKEGVFLANEQFLGTDYIRNNLPTKFKNWKIIYAQDSYQEDRIYWDEITKNPISLASSRGMDINVLSLNRNEILINDDAFRTAELLYKNGFSPIPIKFRHGEIFAGGIHCSTLDIEREN